MLLFHRVLPSSFCRLLAGVPSGPSVADLHACLRPRRPVLMPRFSARHPPSAHSIPILLAANTINSPRHSISDPISFMPADRSRSLAYAAIYPLVNPLIWVTFYPNQLSHAHRGKALFTCADVPLVTPSTSSVATTALNPGRMSQIQYSLLHHEQHFLVSRMFGLEPRNSYADPSTLTQTCAFNSTLSLAFIDSLGHSIGLATYRGRLYIRIQALIILPMCCRYADAGTRVCVCLSPLALSGPSFDSLILLLTYCECSPRLPMSFSIYISCLMWFVYAP